MVENGHTDDVAAIGGCDNWYRNSHSALVNRFTGNGRTLRALATLSGQIAITGYQREPRRNIDGFVVDANKVKVSQLA